MPLSQHFRHPDQGDGPTTKSAHLGGSHANKARGPQQVPAAPVIVALWPVAVIDTSRRSHRRRSHTPQTPWVAAREFCAAFARDDPLHTTVVPGDGDALSCDGTAFPEVQLWHSRPQRSARLARHRICGRSRSAAPKKRQPSNPGYAHSTADIPGEHFWHRSIRGRRNQPCAVKSRIRTT